MAKIETYNLASSPISGADKLIGTDSANNNDTKNFSVQEVYDFVKPYKVYVALLNQSGTDAPTAIVLENTLGANIVWTYNGVGQYTGTLSGAFTSNKTVCFATLGNWNTFVTNVALERTNNNSVSLLTFLPNDNTYNEFNNLSVEIRVYQ